jgi:mono/diheme cytochrome c family protein
VRIVATITAVSISLLTSSGGLGAQEALQNATQVERGHAIADKVCWVCHVTGSDQEYSPVLRDPGPDFRTIAAKPGTTAASLTAFLHTAHRTEDKPYTMPNPGLSDEMIAAVVGYILSLKPHS